ncbi:MAG: NAD(+)/NADH kinase [Dehalococcoidia bacterium]
MLNCLTARIGRCYTAIAVKRIGILYHPLREKARNLADKLEDVLSSQGVSAWRCSAWDEDKAKPQVAGTDLVLSIGGDGTILHCARIVTPSAVPILGINLGRLGFITEIDADEVLSHLPHLLEGRGWIEERTMLAAQVEDEAFHALNDVVLHSVTVRLVNITTEVDGTPITTYRADGVIVATATGSTSYSLAAGGPILHPQSKQIVLQPISCHLGLSHALVLPPESVLNFKVARSEKVILSIDGQVELPLSDGQNIRVKVSAHTARFLRIHEPTYFYSSLWEKLGGRRNES